MLEFECKIPKIASSNKVYVHSILPLNSLIHKHFAYHPLDARHCRRDTSPTSFCSKELER